MPVRWGRGEPTGEKETWQFCFLPRDSGVFGFNGPGVGSNITNFRMPDSSKEQRVPYGERRWGITDIRFFAWRTRKADPFIRFLSVPAENGL